MIVIAQRDEAERLHNSLARSPHGSQHLGHTMNRARLRLKSDLDKIALSQSPAQPQQAAGNGNSLKFGFSALPIFQHDQGCNGAA